MNIGTMNNWHNWTYQCNETFLGHMDYPDQTHVVVERMFLSWGIQHYMISVSTLHRGWETEKKYFLQSDASQMEHFTWATWTYGPMKYIRCDDPFDDHITRFMIYVSQMISCFCRRIPMGQILVRHQVLLKRPKPSEGGDHQVSEQ